MPPPMERRTTNLAPHRGAAGGGGEAASARSGGLQGSEVPRAWRDGVHWTVSRGNDFVLGEPVIVQRTDGRRTFAIVTHIKGDKYDCQVEANKTKLNCSAEHLGKLTSKARDTDEVRDIFPKPPEKKKGFGSAGAGAGAGAGGADSDGEGSVDFEEESEGSVDFEQDDARPDAGDVGPRVLAKETAARRPLDAGRPPTSARKEAPAAHREKERRSREGGAQDGGMMPWSAAEEWHGTLEDAYKRREEAERDALAVLAQIEGVHAHMMARAKAFEERRKQVMMLERELENAREGRRLMEQQMNSLGLDSLVPFHKHTAPHTEEEEAAALRAGLLLSMAEMGASSSQSLDLSVPPQPTSPNPIKRQLDGLGVSEVNLLGGGGGRPQSQQPQEQQQPFRPISRGTIHSAFTQVDSKDRGSGGGERGGYLEAEDASARTTYRDWAERGIAVEEADCVGEVGRSASGHSGDSTDGIMDEQEPSTRAVHGASANGPSDEELSHSLMYLQAAGFDGENLKREVLQLYQISPANRGVMDRLDRMLQQHRPQRGSHSQLIQGGSDASRRSQLMQGGSEASRRSSSGIKDGGTTLVVRRCSGAKFRLRVGDTEEWGAVVAKMMEEMGARQELKLFHPEWQKSGLQQYKPGSYTRICELPGFKHGKDLELIETAGITSV